SDTVTRPTEEMRKAMYDAEVGDDVHHDDPTVNKLEELAAEKIGKQAALFVPSGTMGNTIAMIVGAEPGKEVILEEKCHILNFEMGNVSRIAHAVPRALPSHRGKIPLDVIEENIHVALREHMTQTKAITIENTHNIWGGALLGLDYIKDVAALAKKYNLYLHLDGARVFNASIALNIDVREITKYFDSVMFCLSKGLSAPVGSILAGTKEFIKEARYTRKFLGGGMRQAGVIAAAGIVAIEKMIDRLADDHRRAKQLAEQIADLPGIEVNPDEVETNIIMVKLTTMNSDTFLKKLAERNVWALPFNDETVRIVTHKDIDDNDIEQAINAIRMIG
nr:aminotransferase class I/II-fold pyridoxal phosphate-dependent enzyme [Candidatus Aminicenantes bacterium]NIM79400.1 aminotransferase class I/II-fold pyridoxal phosphate-dependent enzyme [Candidatus Aminicenantes bacterium]NIN18677.1 aminotransferase class I/II-fold pyridoxal phosphate-dependent enzyme [Candidatus Aminicenantes bacterium]NIN42566.1 aminotransferase class I/II-fold pyridoxal phosphate-dependent enzyme [Candidatus Aminicenantes bacterium]NIN85332.1 aminotransferase class I/II-